MSAVLLRALLLFLALFSGATGLLCFVRAVLTSLNGSLLLTLGWLALAALGALGVVYLPALGGTRLWQPPSRF